MQEAREQASVFVPEGSQEETEGTESNIMFQFSDELCCQEDNSAITFTKARWQLGKGYFSYNFFFSDNS